MYRKFILWDEHLRSFRNNDEPSNEQNIQSNADPRHKIIVQITVNYEAQKNSKVADYRYNCSQLPSNFCFSDFRDIQRN